jgi:putative deaminase/isomerase
LNIVYCETYEALSAQAGALVIDEIGKQKDLLLCAATGNSPIGLYDALASKSATDSGLFAKLRIIKLDEWSGIPEQDPGSCEHYLRTRLLDPLGIAPERYIAFAATPADPAAECHRVRTELERRGPIDLCILGLGINGHLGFNEPGPFLIPHCHVAHLSEESRRHAMVRTMDDAPRLGMTLGMQEILAARKIVLLVAGSGKQQAIAGLLTGKVSTTLPASCLWLHGNVDCLIDQMAVADHGQRAETIPRGRG